MIFQIYENDSIFLTCFIVTTLNKQSMLRKMGACISIGTKFSEIELSVHIRLQKLHETDDIIYKVYEI